MVVMRVPPDDAVGGVPAVPNIAIPRPGPDVEDETKYAVRPDVPEGRTITLRVSKFVMVV